MTAGLLLGTPMATALIIVRSAAVPMLVANALGMAVFVVIVRNVLEERRTREAKEAIEGELRVARDIQMGIVPRMFPAFPDRPEVDLFAMLDSAKEVGGDFYDYYALDRNRIFFVIGDVVGKGVPASLFMAVTMTLFKAYARADRSPVEVVARVNDRLSHDNETGLFVTAFCGVLDLRTGRLDYANAGHNLPVTVRPGGPTAFLPRTGGLVLGAVPDFRYQTGTITMSPGDTLVTYTDGVTEAMDRRHALFGNERLLEVCRIDRHLAPRELAEDIVAAVRTHVGDAPQSDDLTILVVRYRGNPASTMALDESQRSGI
jgi:sigma-B regulation protein RsbU (phosphoserine phosphatase)